MPWAVVLSVSSGVGGWGCPISSRISRRTVASLAFSNKPPTSASAATVPTAKGYPERRTHHTKRTHYYDKIYRIQPNNEKKGNENQLNILTSQFHIEGDLDHPPNRGLAVARMIGHKTYVSLAAMQERARNEVVSQSDNLDWYHERSILDYFAETGLFMKHGLYVWAEITLRHLIRLRTESPDIGPDHQRRRGSR